MLIQKYIPSNTLRRSSRPLLGVRFIVAHDTGTVNATALNFADRFIKTANDVQASAHAFVDDINIVECIPQTERALHVRSAPEIDNFIFGVDANDYALGVELCYFDSLERSKLAYTQYVDYIKGLHAKYKLDPLKCVVGHYKLDPEKRTDPINAFKRIGVTWEQFIKDLTIIDKSGIKIKIIELLNQL